MEAPSPLLRRDASLPARGVVHHDSGFKAASEVCEFLDPARSGGGRAGGSQCTVGVRQVQSDPCWPGGRRPGPSESQRHLHPCCCLARTSPDQRVLPCSPGHSASGGSSREQPPTWRSSWLPLLELGFHGSFPVKSFPATLWHPLVSANPSTSLFRHLPSVFSEMPLESLNRFLNNCSSAKGCCLSPPSVAITQYVGLGCL